MSNLRRYYSKGKIYFVTSITYNRMPILVQYYELFTHAMQEKLVKRQAKIHAWVLLPDHFHMLIDPLDNNLSKLMKSFKLSFSENLRKSEMVFSGRIWQYRFWDHIIRDQNDMNIHIDYIHYNPIKHEIVSRPTDWPHSSFHTFISEGYYPADWGIKDKINFKGDFGE